MNCELCNIKITSVTPDALSAPLGGYNAPCDTCKRIYSVCVTCLLDLIVKPSMGSKTWMCDSCIRDIKINHIVNE